MPTYYNWSPGSGEPTKSFPTLVEAEAEAIRLSAKKPNAEVVTLEAVRIQPSQRVLEKELLEELASSGLLSNGLQNRLEELLKNRHKHSGMSL